MDGAFPSSLAEGEGDRRRGFRGTEENAKTKLCLRWKSGHCRFGDACNFAHGEEELRQLPPRSFSGGGGSGGGSGGGRGRGGFGYEPSYGPGFGGGPGPMDQGGYFPRGATGGGRQGPGGMSQGTGMPAFSEPRPHEGSRPASNNDLWAAQGYPVQGPNGWTQYTTLDTGEPYYHNHVTGDTVWDKPPEWR